MYAVSEIIAYHRTSFAVHNLHAGSITCVVCSFPIQPI